MIYFFVAFMPVPLCGIYVKHKHLLFQVGQVRLFRLILPFALALCDLILKNPVLRDLFVLPFLLK
jgi:hypothetical protein